MTGHAKALADALRHAKPLVEKWCFGQGNDRVFLRATMDPIDNALAAYDAHLAEAATRENDLVARLTKYASQRVMETDFPSDDMAVAMREAARALSTHQQQGDQLSNLKNPDNRGQELALPVNARARQPDTVTEDRVERVELRHALEHVAQCGSCEECKQLATAALAARGK